MTRRMLFLFGMMLPALVFGQGRTGDPFPPKGHREPDPRRQEEPLQPDPALDAWIALLVTRLDDANDAIRRSAGSALVTVGEPALPALRRVAAEEAREKAAGHAQRLIRDIERRGRAKKRGGPGPWNHDDGGQERFRQALTEAGFTTDQLAAIDAAGKKRHQRTLEVFRQIQDGEIGLDERSEAMRRVNQEIDDALTAALGDEAMARYRDFMKKLRHRGGRRGGGLRDG